MTRKAGASFLAAATLLFLLPLARGSTAEFVRGDVNAERIIDISDPIRIFGYLFLGDPAELDCEDAADADDSGELDITDGVYLLSYLFTGGRPPPPPTGECGGDATPDLLGCAGFPPCAPAKVTRIESTSPVDGEGDVAITRETIIRFNRPLGAGGVTAEALSAHFGGQVLEARLHLSPDHRTATLFYPNRLPPSARVRVRIDGGLLLDGEGSAVDADGDGEPGGIATIDFETLSLVTLPGTAVCGRVFASQLAQSPGGEAVNEPLLGVRITVDGREESFQAFTDAQGNFRLDPCPAGRFFVHVHGFTARNPIPRGAYYPFVGKAWESVPGQETNIGNVYLPVIPAETLRPVSAVEDTAITFPPAVLAEHPELEGVSIVVPADSAFADDGTRGGSVGIAPVPPDRLPGPLPPGLSFPIVITVQTDGASNFDRPVPACFPNLKDPGTGEPLPAGAKSALWSFNHDSGSFEVVGPMTVSADGELVCTDPGVGIPAPGWHGSAPGTDAGGGPPRGPPDDDDDCPKKSPWEIAEIIWDIAKQAADCAASLGGVKKGLKCALDLIDSAKSIYQAIQELREQADDVDTTREALKAMLGPLKAGKEGLVRLLACFEAQSPVGKARAIFDCLGNLLAIADEICKALDDPDDPPPPQCQPSRLVRRVCKGIAFALAIHQEVAHIIELLENIKEQLALTLLCEALEVVERIICPPGGGGGSELTAEERQRIRAELANAQRAVDVIFGAREAGQKALVGFDSVGDTVRQMVEDADGALEESGAPVEAPYLYAIEIAGTVIRGESSRQGALDLRLAPEEDYFLAKYDPARDAYSETHGVTARNGERTRLPGTVLGDAAALADGDGDGLADRAEFVVGTDASKPDTDGDGVSDLAEVRQGLDPLDGRPARTGIIATAATPGTAVDVTAVNDLVAVAHGEEGLSVFNVFNGMDPVVIARVGTPASAQAVAGSGDHIAVACGAAGLSVVDISDPPSARVVSQVPLRGSAQALAAAGGVAYVGLSSYQVTAVDLKTGEVLDQVVTPAPVHDVAIAGNHLFVLVANALQAYALFPAFPRLLGSLATPDLMADGIVKRKRLFVGGGFAYSTAFYGYNTFDVRDLSAMRQLGSAQDGGPNSFKQIVLNGSGLGVAAVGTNPRPDGLHDIYLYDVTDLSLTTRFLTAIPTPGFAHALSIYNSLAYIADGEAGLQVLNYLPYDASGKPPAILISLPGGTMSLEEGQPSVLSALVTDDVQVRNVEFQLDGDPVVIDGNFPFEYHFRAPRRAQKEAVTFKARATDTGGNVAWSGELTAEVTIDSTPPQVLKVVPAEGAVAAPDRIGVFFSEAMARETLTATAVLLQEAGADGQHGTPDDVYLSGGRIEPWKESNGVFLVFPAALPSGNYQARVTDAVADLAGNRLPLPFRWSFSVCSECYDLAGDFLLVSNPGPHWGYGAARSLGAFSAFTHLESGNPPFKTWRRAPEVPEDTHGTPQVGKNERTGLVTIHPGPDSFAVVRWTAPGRGVYRVDAEFRDGDSATTDLHVLRGSREIYAGRIERPGDARAFHSSLFLPAGEHLDFAVGNGGNGHFFDTTFISVTIRQAAGMAFDLAEEWSDTVNPNGPWSYNEAPGVPIATHLDNWGCGFPGPQRVWAAAPCPQPGHVPMWFKALTTGFLDFLDVPAGAVGIHGSETSTAGVSWRAPAAGTAEVSGGIWIADKHVGRNMRWAIAVHETEVSSGLLSFGDPYASANPFRFADGAGGESALTFPVSAGDVVHLQVTKADGFATFVGVDFTVTLLEEEP